MEKLLRDEFTHLAILGKSLKTQHFSLKEYLDELEQILINQAMSEAGGVVAQAAKLLGLKRTTLVEKIRKYKISACNLNGEVAK